MDQHALTALEFGAIEQPEPGEVEGKVEGSRVRQGNLVGHLEGGHQRTHRVLGEAAVGTPWHRHHALVLPAVGAVTAGLDHAHHLHAGAVRQLGTHHHVAAGDAFQIVQVERDGLHADAHLACLRLGDRHGVELQHLGRVRAVLVRPPGAHRSWRQLPIGHALHVR